MSRSSDANVAGGPAIPEDVQNIFSIVNEQFYTATSCETDIPLFSLGTVAPCIKPTHDTSQNTDGDLLVSEGQGPADDARGTKKRLRAQRVRSRPTTICDEDVPFADMFTVVQAQFYQHVLGKDGTKPMFQMNPEPPPRKPVSDAKKQTISKNTGSPVSQSASQKKTQRKRTRPRKHKKDDSYTDDQEGETVVPRKHGNVDQSLASKSAEVLSKPEKKTSQQRRKEKAKEARRSAGSSISETLTTSKGAPQKPEKSTISTKRRVLDPEQLLSSLEKEFMYPLKKPALGHPNARFYCRLCSYHLNDVGHCNKHMKDNRHKRLKRLQTADFVYESIPPPTPAHATVLTRLLQRVLDQQALTDKDLQQRQQLTDKIRALLKTLVPDADVSLYGSSRNGFGLKKSDVNIDVKAEKAAAALKLLYATLKEDTSGYYSNVESDFSANVPSVLFTVPSLGNVKVRVGVSTGNTFGASSLTTQLLHTYCKIDERVQALGVPFRYWAKLCKIDSQDQGTLPAYVFGMMTIYFLQQCDPPVLPVLHVIGRDSQKNGGCSDNYYFNNLEHLGAHWKCRNTESVGALWLRMCKFYALGFDTKETVICIRQKVALKRSEKKWTKRLPIEDPFMRRRNVTRCLSHTSIFEYIYERLRAMYQYFAIPCTPDGPILKSEDFSKVEEAVAQSMKLQQQTQSHGSTIKYSHSRSPNKLADFSFGEGSNFKFNFNIKDKKATADSTNKPSGTEQYFTELTDNVIRDAVQIVTGSTENVNLLVEHQSSNMAHAIGAETVAEVGVSKVSPVCSESVKQTESELVSIATSIVQSAIEEGVKVTSKVDKPISTSKRNSNNDTDKEVPMTTGNNPVLELYDPQHVAAMSESDYVYTFDAKSLTDKTGPSLWCLVCQKQGHLRQNCPEDKLPPLRPLPALTQQYNLVLSSILTKVPSDFEPRKDEYWARQELRSRLETCIQYLYPSAKLSLFGSSCNGFSFAHSDLDICMTFDDDPDAQNVDCQEVIKALHRHLRKEPMLLDVHAITNAKVPIVKFIYRSSGLEGDISLYNILAVHNTSMLDMYSKIDYRVRALGYTMKVFAKLCDICDASKGSLSSYAYILMVLYFLQQRSPPVIPVLQELHSVGKKPERMVDGWNAWYYSDMDILGSVWTGLNKNTETLAELWIGLLRFYTEEFNFKDFVICTRQHEPLTRFEKLWNGKCIAIEDPFDLGHNLGAGLSAKMNTFIVKAFHNGRSHFGVPLDSIPPRYRSIEDFLFDPDILTEGPPPADRNCRACGRIGHWAKECQMKQEQKHEPEKMEAQKHRENKSPKQKERHDGKERSIVVVKSRSTDVAEAAKNSKQQKSRQGGKIDQTKKQERPSDYSQGQAKGQGRSKSATNLDQNQRKQTQSQKQKTDQNGGIQHHRKVFYNSQHAQHRSSQPRQHQPSNHPPNQHQPSNRPPNQGLTPPRQGQNQYIQPLLYMNPTQVGYYPVTGHHVTHNPVQHNPVQHNPVQHNPVQQLFMSGAANQMMPAMPASRFSYQRTTPQRHVAIAPHNALEGGHTSLTWQQDLLQQRVGAAMPSRGKKSRKVHTPSTGEEEQFPNLEIKVANSQLTWQQQEMAQMSQKRNRKRGRGYTPPSKTKPE